MVSFNYNFQNPSLLLFLVLISAVTRQELQIKNNKEKRKEFW